jgi:hypothetical protein
MQPQNNLSRGVLCLVVVFESVIVIDFKSVFRVEMHENKFFLFLKNN